MARAFNTAIEPTRYKVLVGAAGVHFVVSELSLRGLIALPTIRNTAGIDVVVVNKSGTWQANLQVKTSRSKVTFWPVGKHYDAWRGPNNYYAFVRYCSVETLYPVSARGVSARIMRLWVSTRR
jgi:hypothetical protein